MPGKPQPTSPCRFCDAPVPGARVAIGYTHCTSNDCVVMFRRERSVNLRTLLVPKQGFTVIDIGTSEPPSGRSSGR